MIRLASALCLAAALASPQSSSLSRTMTEGAHRMELVLERLDRDTWRTIDPGLVLAQGDRVRFKFRTNFDGYLYVMNQSTSGTYEQLFPTRRGRPGQPDLRLEGIPGPRHQRRLPHRRTRRPRGRLLAGHPRPPQRSRSALPAPAGQESSAARPHPALRRHHPEIARRLRRSHRRSQTGAPRRSHAAEPHRSVWDANQRDLLFMRQKNTAVISSPVSLTGPVIYEYRLAHR